MSSVRVSSKPPNPRFFQLLRDTKAYQLHAFRKLSRHISNSTFATATYLSQGNLTSSYPDCHLPIKPKHSSADFTLKQRSVPPGATTGMASKSPATWPQGRGLPVLQRFLRFLKKRTKKSSMPCPHHHRPSWKCSLSQVIKLFFSGPHLKSKPAEKAETQ